MWQMGKSKKELKLVLVLVISLLIAIQNMSAQKLVVSDPLNSAELVDGEKKKINSGGQYTDTGWQALKNGDYLMIEITEGAGLEGSFEVDIRNLNNGMAGNKESYGKIHFLNMFSNPIADHHAEDGGTANDALWTLRTGTDEEGKPRYWPNFKILWASKGVKRTEGSDYHEDLVRMPENWTWDQRVYTFRVDWSQKGKFIDVYVNSMFVFRGKWNNQVSPLKYVWLAKSPDFNTLAGPIFSNLKISQLINID